MGKSIAILSMILSILLFFSLALAQEDDIFIKDSSSNDGETDGPNKYAADIAIFDPTVDPVDPIAPTPQPPGQVGPQGGGGGGGGGSSTQNLADRGSCVTEWVCSEWTQCLNGKQTRTCTKKALNCFADPKKKPSETQTCTVESSSEQNQEEENEGFFARITGAVVGTVREAGVLGVIIFIVIIGGAAYFVYSKRKAKKVAGKNAK